MLIGGSGLILISEFISDNGLILIKWEKRRLKGEWSAAIWSGSMWFDADRRQWCDVDWWSSSCSSRDVDHGEWGERESEVRATERQREREKLLKYLCKCYSNRALCTVTVVIVHKCIILHPLMWVLFWAKMCKSTTFFYFAKVSTGWCNCFNIVQ